MVAPRSLRAGLLTLSLFGAGVSAAAAQTPPSIPTLPAGDVERFAMTVSGFQSTRFDFLFNPDPAQPCPLLAEGWIQEDWTFNRGKRVVMEFRRLGPGLVVIGRAGRPLGDAAFATQGKVGRVVSGFLQAPVPPSPACPTNPLTTPACGRKYKAPADLRLAYGKGVLALEASDSSNLRPNPAVECGRAGINFGDNFSFAYPGLNRQTVKLPIKRLFNSRRNLRLELDDRFIAPTDAGTDFVRFDETLNGKSTLTLTRLKSR